MADNPTKSVLLVKKSDAKKGSLWNDIANQRIFKQHGGFDIPEGDLHAIAKIPNPLNPQTVSDEETKETLSDIEKEIQKLKNNDQKPLSLGPNEYTDPSEDEEIKNYSEYEDEQS